MVPARVARAMSAAPQLDKRSDSPGPSCMQRPVSVQAKPRIAHRGRAITRSRQFSDRRRSTRGHCSSANLRARESTAPLRDVRARSMKQRNSIPRIFANRDFRPKHARPTSRWSTSSRQLRTENAQPLYKSLSLGCWRRSPGSYPYRERPSFTVWRRILELSTSN